MFSPRRFAGGYSLSLATSLLLLTSLAHGEPPLMKEQSVEPKIQAISPDGRFAISLGGFLQARYRGASIEKEADVSQFGNPRARLYSFGYIHSKDFRYRLMMGTPPHSQQVQLFDAYVEVRMADELRLRAGRFKMPVFREWVESARLQSSTERSALTMLLSPGRDYGLMASGSFLHENIEYALGVFNGAGEVAAVDSNATPAFAGRMVWNTTGRSIEGEVDFHHSPLAVAIGASGSSAWKPSTPAVTPAQDLPHLREHRTGVEVTLRWDSLDVAVELMARRRELSGFTEDTGGGFVRVTKFLPLANVSFGGRATHFLSSRSDGPRRSELEAEFGYYLDEHDLKFSLDVGSARIGRQATTERFLQAQAQVAF